MGTPPPPVPPEQPLPDQTRELLRFLREENDANRQAVRDEGEANRTLLLDTVKFVSIPVSLIIAIAAILGFKSLSDLKQTLQSEASRETKTEVTRMQGEIRDTLKKQFQTPELQKMVKEAAGDSTRTAAEPLIKSEVAVQVKSRIDAQKGDIATAVHQQTQSAVKEMGPQIDSLVKDALDTKIQSQFTPVIDDLKNEANTQLLITRMNADDAEAFDALVQMPLVPNSSPYKTVSAALISVIEAHNAGIYMSRSFSSPHTPEQLLTDLSSPDNGTREAALDTMTLLPSALPKIVDMITSDSSLNVRTAAHRQFNRLTGQQFRALDKNGVLNWWQANKNRFGVQ